MVWVQIIIHGPYEVGTNSIHDSRFQYDIILGLNVDFGLHGKIFGLLKPSFLF